MGLLGRQSNIDKGERKKEMFLEKILTIKVLTRRFGRLYGIDQ